jgi:hypothetical protein
MTKREKVEKHRKQIAKKTRSEQQKKGIFKKKS